ncbi:MAG: hypothetical protein A3J94_12820 [Syntrophus sp. RIFOXYC2_FULL_54_9]|nr:MAG: hypothetical protein A3J94_12820 [Syntrophus sp. RIFOXYC2_FULL_54_9]
MYKPHKSESLITHFHDKPWQGNDPLLAIFLFVGLDANYDANIDEALPETFDYLDDSVMWWQTNEERVHHPFLLPHYRGSGRRYHVKFAEIGFTPANAGLVSFVELLNIPTTGRSNLILADLCTDYLSELNNKFDTGAARYIFVSRRVTELMRQSKCFSRLLPNPLPMDGDLKVLRNENGQIIYEMYHLSCYGWQLAILNRQIAQIREMLRNFIRGL